jgi:hypothetical protein
MPGLVKVRPVHPYQVSHEGQVYGPGAVAEVPLHVATHWTQNGWVEGVKDEPKSRN